MNLSLYEQEARLLAAHEEMDEALERGDEIPASALAVVEEYALSVAEKRDACAAVLRRLDGECDYIGAEIKRLYAIKVSREHAVDRLRTYILRIMQEHNVQKVRGVTTTFTVVKNPDSVEVGVEAAALPAEFQRVIPATVEADKKAIGAALKRGEVVPFCRLKPGDHRLQVR
jgi:hypothetical protein